MRAGREGRFCRTKEQEEGIQDSKLDFNLRIRTSNIKFILSLRPDPANRFSPGAPVIRGARSDLERSEEAGSPSMTRKQEKRILESRAEFRRKGRISLLFHQHLLPLLSLASGGTAILGSDRTLPREKPLEARLRNRQN